jgi:hypothetical protein
MFGKLVSELTVRWINESNSANIHAVVTIRTVPAGMLITSKYNHIAVPVVRRADTKEDAIKLALLPPLDDYVLWDYDEKEVHE